MTKVKVGLGCLLELLKKDPIVKIVSELPPKETAELNFIYLVPKDNAGQDKRAYVLRPDRSGYDAIDLSPQVIDVVGEGLITVKKEVHNENGDVTFTVTTSPSFQAVLDSLTAKDKELDTKVSALEAKDAVHEAKLSAIEAKDSEQDTKLEALKAHDDQVDDALEAVGKTIEKTVDLIDAKVLELKKDNERQDGALDDLGESVKDLNESVQHLDEEHGKAIADLQKDSQGLKELTSELDNSINEINDQLKLLDGGLEEEVKAIHTEVGDITNAVTELENRTDKLAKDAEDKAKAQAEKDGSQDAEIEALKKKDAEVETALETLGETLGKTVDLIDHKAEGLDTRVKALEAKEDSDKQTLAIAGNKLSISNGNEVDLPQYDDTSVKDSIKQANDYTESVKNFLEGKNDALTTRVNVLEEAKPVVENKLTEIEAKNTAQDEKITALENRTDNFINNVTVSKEAGKVKLTYSRVDGSSSEVEFEDSDTVTLAYDDEPLKTRIKALEDKEDKDTIYNDTEVKQGIQANTASITALDTKVDGNKQAQDGKNTELENRIQALETKPDKDTVYDDTELKGKVEALTTRVTTDESAQAIKDNAQDAEIQALKAKDAELAKSITDNKADADTKVQGLDTRLQAIEAKEDSDKQTLSLTDHTLSISNGNSVELPKYDDTVVKAKNTEQDEELKALKERTKSFLTGASVTRQGNVVTLTYTNIDGSSTNLEFNDNDTKAIAYDDTALKARVQDLENRADNDTIYNDAPIKERITALENKTDKDTVYDDAPLKERLTALETKVDKDTVYDDSAVRQLIQANKDSIATTDNMVDEHENKINTLTTDVEALKAKPDKDTVYDDSAVTARLTALETKEDKDTVYNDKELRDKITALEGKTDNFVSNVGVSREGNTVKLTYTMVNGDNKEVSFTDNDTISVAYDDSALRGRVEALENKPEVEYDLAKTTKAVTPSQGEGVINLASEATTDPLKELVLTGNVSAKVKSPFGGDETTVAGKVGFNSGTTGDAISGSHTTAVSENVYVEFYYTDSTVKAYLVYEPDNENEVVKYRKALSLAELQGTEPARISISKAGVEQGYVEVTFTGVALNINSYKVQKKG